MRNGHTDVHADSANSNASAQHTTPVRTILIVEDDADLRRLYASALRIAGYVVRESGDGLSALHQLDEVRPDCIVLDLMLPRLSGYAVRSELAASAEMRDIPIVIVTGTEADSSRLGTSCILRKPALPDDVVVAVERCIAIRVRRSDPIAD
jgi:CheY-like chemotaxis protein